MEQNVIETGDEPAGRDPRSSRHLPSARLAQSPLVAAHSGDPSVASAPFCRYMAGTSGCRGTRNVRRRWLRPPGRQRRPDLSRRRHWRYSRPPDLHPGNRTCPRSSGVSTPMGHTQLTPIRCRRGVLPTTRQKPIAAMLGHAGAAAAELGQQAGRREPCATKCPPPRSTQSGTTAGRPDVGPQVDVDDQSQAASSSPRPGWPVMPALAT